MTLANRKRPSNRDKYIWRNMLEHVLIVERLIGKALPKGVEIHHVDGNGRNNSHSNLVVCPNHAYHSLLHMRITARNACGNAEWRKCCFCKKWDAPENLAFWYPGKSRGVMITHRECANSHQRDWRARKPEWREKKKEAQRFRYATDPEYKKLCNHRNVASYNRRQNNV